MFNLFKMLIGRRAKVYGTLIQREEGTPRVPGMAFVISRYWFDHKHDVMDVISFLLVAEALGNHREGDFIYNKKHDDTQMEIHFPAWAIRELQQQCAELGPKLYEWLKKADQNAREAADKLEESGVSKEIADQIRKVSGVEKYKQIHAQVNGYMYQPETPQEEIAKKVLH